LTAVHHPIEPWAANLILPGVTRLDCAITTRGCIMRDLDDDPESENLSEVEAIRWLYGVLREEAQNIRQSVSVAQGQNASMPKMLSVAKEPV
jgi:hypothetical protein